MKPIGLEEYTPVCVSWFDSSVQRGWHYPTPPNKKFPDDLFAAMPVLSVGFVINSNKKFFTISSSAGQDGATIDPLSIPWGCIKAIRKLTITRRLKK